MPPPPHFGKPAPHSRVSGPHLLCGIGCLVHRILESRLGRQGENRRFLCGSVAGASDVALAAITFWAISSRCRIRKNAGRFATFRILANAATDENCLSRQRLPGLRTSKTLIVENLISFLVNRMFDPAPAQDAISVIKNNRLTGCDGALGFVEVNASAAVG